MRQVAYGWLWLRWWIFDSLQALVWAPGCSPSPDSISYWDIPGSLRARLWRWAFERAYIFGDRLLEFRRPR